MSRRRDCFGPWACSLKWPVTSCRLMRDHELGMVLAGRPSLFGL